MRAKFEFTYKDLFIKGDNNFYYFQIIFPSSFTNNWILESHYLKNIKWFLIKIGKLMVSI